MKKPVSIILATLMLLVLCGPALAGSDEIITVGPVQIARGELDRLKAMVAGDPVPPDQAPAVEPRVNLGAIELSFSDLEGLKAMIAGTYLAPVQISAPWANEGEKMVDVGKVVLSRTEYESLKEQVAGQLYEVQSHLARINLP